MKIVIDPKYIRALIPLAGKDDIRFYLNSIYLEANAFGSKLVALDGHCAGVIRSDFPLDEIGESEDAISLIIPLYIAQILAKEKREFTLEVGERKDVSTMRDCAATISDDVRISFTSMDGEYPNWRRVAVLGKSEEATPSQFNPKLIVAFSKTAKALGSKDGHIMIWHRGEQAAGVYIETERNFFGVLMPMSSRFLKSGTPDWIEEAA